MIYYTVYKITNKIDGKIYIGKHQTKDINDEYMGSGKRLLYAIKKYGMQNFTKEILFIFDNKEAMDRKEFEIVNSEFVMREDTYNIALGGQGGKLFPHKYTLNLSEEERNRRSIQTVNVHTGSKRSKETKEKMRKSQTGKTKSESTKLKIRESLRKSLPTYICDVCNKEGKGNTMKIYHFENCKYKSQ
jgi:hypothetical protein